MSSEPFQSIPLEDCRADGKAQEINRSSPHQQLNYSSSTTNNTPSSSKGMLLRLFQSEFFTSTQAVYYLYKYASEPGIQFYLCERLKNMPHHDIEFLLPQICHLMVTNNYSSAPIETLVIELCKNHSHISFQVLWILENYLADLRVNNKNATTYLRTARILCATQKAVFRQEIPDKVRHHTRKLLIRAADHLKTFFGVSATNGKYSCTGPAVAGFGAMLASFCCPQLARSIRPLVLMQARKADPYNQFNAISEQRRAYSIHSGGHLGASKSPLSSPAVSDHSNYSTNNITTSELSGPTLEELSHGRAFSIKRYISKTAKGLLSTNKSASSLTLSSDFDYRAASKSALSPTLFPTIPFYYQSEMQFVSSLISVSERLKSLNRSSCLKALHAELCLVNHNLPASICIPSWCRGHHRVLSVLPYESCVLNSAERVPYIVFIEIVYGISEADFDHIISEKHSSTASDDGSASYISDNSQDPISSPTFEENNQVLALAESQSQEKIATASGMVDVTERMRTAAVMLAQLARQSLIPNADIQSINIIRSRIINEMEQLEKDRLIDILQNTGKLSRPASQDALFDEKAAEIHPVIDKRDPSAAIFREDWASKKKRIAKSSPYSSIPGWDIISVVVKSDTDMRQEHLAYQLVSEIKNIFSECNLDIFLHPCKVLVASNNGGLIEVVPNSISVHSIKKSILLAVGSENSRPEMLSIKSHFVQQYGSHDSQEYMRASENFLQSLVGYSLLTYVLQIRDRHNGNILIDREGHLIHIDFGFMLSNSPGYVGFESAPFKLTLDYLEMLEGVGSEKWQRFRRLFLQGLLAIRKHSDRLNTILELMMKDSLLPCFYTGETTLIQFRERLHLTLTENQIEQLVDKLMATSALNVFTRLYDSYQYYTNSIL